MLEKGLEEKIKKHLKKNNHYFIKYHGGYFSRSGVPDILACINGKFVGLEIKRPDKKGKISELQKAHIKNINNSGGIALVIDDYNKYLEFYEKIKGGGKDFI